MTTTTQEPSPLEVSQNNIWCYEQNRPILIARDLNNHYGIPITSTLRILMARGVFKWLANRRHLIKLKDSIRKQLSELQSNQRQLKKTNYCLYLETKGRIKALTEIRAEIRKICHSERWQFVDIDKTSQRIMEEYHALIKNF